MYKTILFAAAVLWAGAAQAGEPMTDAQEIQAIQSGLTILGYDPGVIDGRMGPRTQAAIDAYAAETGFVESDAVPEGLVSNAVLGDVGPALAESFGLDPTGSWDIDWSASGMEPLDEDQWTCRDSGTWYFSGGIVWRSWQSGYPILLTLVGDRLETLPPPSGDFIESNAFVAVDANTMHREVEGMTEVWVRCDDWVDDGAADSPDESQPAQ